MGKRNLWEWSAIASICLMLAACGGGGDSSDGTGKLSVSITDAPIHDAQHVYVDFLGAEVRPADGPALMFYFCKVEVDPVDPQAKPWVVQETECPDDRQHKVRIDLLEQTGGASALLLDGVGIPPGKVNWVRLVLAEPAGEIVLSMGAAMPLTVPSGSQTGLKLNRGFVVPKAEDGEAKVYIDFDVRKSIVEVHSTVPLGEPPVPPSYKLKPTLRMVEDFGAIEGKVSSTLMTDCLDGSIYVFSGAGATPDDIDRDKGDPVSSALVELDVKTGIYSYRADFLEPGDYTVAFVCAGEDDPDEENNLGFIDVQTATVIDDLTTPIDFSPPVI